MKRLAFRITAWSLWLVITALLLALFMPAITMYFLSIFHGWIVCALRDWAGDSDYYDKHCDILMIWNSL
jgi:hypothetical protein